MSLKDAPEEHRDESSSISPRERRQSGSPRRKQSFQLAPCLQGVGRLGGRSQRLVGGGLLADMVVQGMLWGKAVSHASL